MTNDYLTMIIIWGIGIDERISQPILLQNPLSPIAISWRTLKTLFFSSQSSVPSPMINPKSLQKVGLLGSLYVSQFIPIAFLYKALPVLMRQRGASLEAICFLPLLTLPWMLKFLWSPPIDRYGFTRWGHYRFWIICFQPIVACTLVAFAFIDINTQLNLGFLCLVVICFVCASRDVATDALAVGLLEPHERGFGKWRTECR